MYVQVYQLPPSINLQRLNWTWGVWDLGNLARHLSPARAVAAAPSTEPINGQVMCNIVIRCDIFLIR